jgi:hypothetical protein
MLKIQYRYLLIYFQIYSASWIIENLYLFSDLLSIVNHRESSFIFRTVQYQESQRIFIYFQNCSESWITENLHLFSDILLHVPYIVFYYLIIYIDYLLLKIQIICFYMVSQRQIYVHEGSDSLYAYTDKPAYVVTSIKQSSVLQGHLLNLLT